MTELYNAAMPRPKSDCPRCSGTGDYYEPAEAVQREQIREGVRRFLTSRVCDCYAVPR